MVKYRIDENEGEKGSLKAPSAVPTPTPATRCHTLAEALPASGLHFPLPLKLWIGHQVWVVRSTLLHAAQGRRAPPEFPAPD